MRLESGACGELAECLEVKEVADLAVGRRHVVWVLALILVCMGYM